MRQEFFSIFSLLSRDYTSGIVGRRATPILDILRARRIDQIVIGAIESAERQLPKGKTLRPDARHFLLVNLMEMVVAPLAIAADRFLSGQEESLLNELGDNVHHDTYLITQRAAEMTEGEEISSNKLVEALGMLLRDLRLNRFEVWG